MKKSILTLLIAFTLAALAIVVPVANAGQSQQAIIREKLGEIGAWAVPSPTQSTVSSKPVSGQSQQAIIRGKLGEIGAWAVPSPTQSTVSSKPVSGQSQQAIIRGKLGEIGAWAVPSNSTQTEVVPKSVPAPPTTVVASSSDFDWNDAGIGAAFVFGAVFLGASLVTFRRRQHHGPVVH
jgi:hypothetical protein